jgi:hypothetical protein
MDSHIDSIKAQNYSHRKQGPSHVPPMGIPTWEATILSIP